VDISGSPVIDSELVLIQAADRRTATTPNDGRFAFAPVPCGAAELTIRKLGFEPVSLNVALALSMAPMRVVLRPAPLAEVVTVTARRDLTPALDPGASLTVVSSADVTTAAAAAIDDRLREVPGFGLFRRSSSRTANPTTQGVTMRGLSASGASRTLVLVDGVPLNDSFGGWIAWNRLPPVAIDRIEVLRGPAGDLYGATALGGVIQVLTFEPQRPRLRVSLEAGSAATARGSVYAGAARGLMQGFVAADAGRSDGFLIAAPENRGPVDTRANAHHRSMQIGIGVRPASGLRIDLKGSVFGEERENGTPLQLNDTDLRDAAVSVAGPALHGWWSARLFGQTQRYDQTFSAVSADRSREDLTRVQRVPSESGGADVEWLTAAGRWRWLMGAQARRVSGTSRETQVTAGLFRDLAPTGGREDRWAVFGQAVATAAHDVTIAAGVRAERWNSVGLDARVPAKHRVDVSPRVSVAWAPTQAVTVRAAAHGAFRAPTLNERYRSFRVGDTNTLANDRLDPEQLSGAEASFVVTRPRLSWRATAFTNFLDEAITNVTLTVTPTLITRQRQNAGTIHAHGAEIEVDWRPSARFDLTASWTGTRSRFARSAEAGLAGNRVPQVPGQQAAIRARIVGVWGSVVSASVRYVSAQFDDDRNQFRLRPYAVADLFVGRALSRGVQLFVAVENLANVDYDVGRTPLRTIGPPRSGRAGIRVFLP